MNPISILWCCIVLAGSQEIDHSRMIHYDMVANKTLTYKIIYLTCDDNPDNVISDLVEVTPTFNLDEYIKTKYNKSTIIQIQTLTISEHHE